MTWKTAFLLCCVAGLVTREGLASQPWWDDECQDVAESCEDLAELGWPPTIRNLALALLARDYSIAEAVDLAGDLTELPPDSYWQQSRSELEHYAGQLRGLVAAC